MLDIKNRGGSSTECDRSSLRRFKGVRDSTGSLLGRSVSLWNVRFTSVNVRGLPGRDSETTSFKPSPTQGEGWSVVTPGPGPSPFYSTVERKVTRPTGYRLSIEDPRNLEMWSCPSHRPHILWVGKGVQQMTYTIPRRSEPVSKVRDFEVSRTLG